MADEISLSISLRVVKGSLDVSKAVSDQYDLSASAPNVAGLTQAIGHAAHEAVTMGDVSTLGWAWFRNLHATNFVQIGVDVGSTFYPVARLNAGEACVLRLAQGITLYAQADTGAVVLEKIVFDN